MTYQVFARKYRPPTFEDVVAQDHVTRTLQNAVAHDRVGQGYLFCGPRGTGKTTTARILAKALNCVNGPTATPCGECPACKDITAGSSLDVLEIDAASNTGVDDVRALRERINLTPAGGKKKIYIIDEVHRLSGAAFDALLKTLEEPPEHVVFIFATTEPTKVPETILSRTQRFDFKRVSSLDLADHLKNIAGREGMEIEDAALALLARRADGSVRDSLSLMDQVAAFAGDSVTEQDVVDALGLVDRQTLFDFTSAVAAQDAKAALGLVKSVIESGIDVDDFFAELLDHFRILMILATDKDTHDLLNIGEDERGAYMEQVDYFTVGDIIRLMKMTGDALGDLKTGLDERLVLEVAAVKMASMESTVQFQEILTRLQRNPQGAARAGGDLFGNAKKKDNPAPKVKPADTTSPATTPEPAAAEPVSYSGTVNLPQLKTGWQDFLAVLRRSKTMLSTQLAMAEIRNIKNGVVELAFGNNAAMPAQLVQKPENTTAVNRALSEHFRANLRINVSIDPNHRSPEPKRQRKEYSKEEADKIVANSPRIQLLLKRVDGEVVGVRKVT